MKKIQKIIGKIVNVLIFFVIIAIIACAYSVFSIKVLHKSYVNFFGYSIFEVATGSMRDAINVGDAVLVKINDDYQVGDIVTYKNGNDFITHRVISKNADSVITKGDANNVNDNPVDKELILGKVVKIMPKVGVWKKVVLTPKVIALILITLFVFSILFSYDGSAIKIVASSKAQKEIDDRIESEVNKKVAVINRRKKRVRKVLEATQIINLDDVNERKKAASEKIIEETKSTKANEANQSLEVENVIETTQLPELKNAKNDISQKTMTSAPIEATLILDLDEVKGTINKNDTPSTVEVTQILDLDDVKNVVNKSRENQLPVEVTQILDLDEVKNVLSKGTDKDSFIEATQILDLTDVDNKVNETNIEATQILDLNATQILDLNDINNSTANKENEKGLDVTQILDISDMDRK